MKKVHANTFLISEKKTKFFLKFANKFNANNFLISEKKTGIVLKCHNARKGGYSYLNDSLATVTLPLENERMTKMFAVAKIRVDGMLSLYFLKFHYIHILTQIWYASFNS